MSTAVAQFEGIEGMTGLLSAAIWSQILSRQERQGQTGDLLEIGTYKGRTAILLAHHLQPAEHLHLIDVIPYLLTEKFRAFEGRYSLHIGDSIDARTLVPNYRSLVGRVRFLHSDASHSFANVENDLLLAEELLSPDGVVVIDDYANSHYPQVPAATCYTLFVHNADLAPFLFADNKLYLCRRGRQVEMRLFVRDELFPTVGREHRLCISKTDLDPRFDLYSLLPKASPEDDDVYASQIFAAMVARDSVSQPRFRLELEAIGAEVAQTLRACWRRLGWNARRLLGLVQWRMRLPRQ